MHRPAWAQFEHNDELQSQYYDHLVSGGPRGGRGGLGLGTGGGPLRIAGVNATTPPKQQPLTSGIFFRGLCRVIGTG